MKTKKNKRDRHSYLGPGIAARLISFLICHTFGAQNHQSKCICSITPPTNGYHWCDFTTQIASAISSFTRIVFRTKRKLKKCVFVALVLPSCITCTTYLSWYCQRDPNYQENKNTTHDHAEIKLSNQFASTTPNRNPKSKSSTNIESKS